MHSWQMDPLFDILYFLLSVGKYYKQFYTIIFRNVKYTKTNNIIIRLNISLSIKIDKVSTVSPLENDFQMG